MVKQDYPEGGTKMRLRLSEAKVVSELGKQLVEWLDCKFFGRGQKALVVQDDAERFTIRIYTSRHVYSITATGDAYPDGSGYLGCTAATRMARPGETWTRGNDLPDGEFSKETLHCILCSIVFYEAREVVKEVKQVDDCVEKVLSERG